LQLNTFVTKFLIFKVELDKLLRWLAEAAPHLFSLRNVPDHASIRQNSPSSPTTEKGGSNVWGELNVGAAHSSSIAEGGHQIDERISDVKLKGRINRRDLARCEGPAHFKKPRRLHFSEIAGQGNRLRRSKMVSGGDAKHCKGRQFDTLEHAAQNSDSYEESTAVQRAFRTLHNR